MNTNIESMKKAVQNYKVQREAADEHIKSILEQYGEEAAQREADRQEKKLAPQRAAAEKAIKDASAAGLQAVEAWGRMDGSKLTEDVKLLDAGLVDVGEFNRLKAAHADNFTMLTALKKYGERKNEEAEKAARASGTDFVWERPYNTDDIPTTEAKQRSWKGAEKQALEMLDALDGKGRYSNPADWGATFIKSAMPEQLEHFGEGLQY